uniref:Uncharacterized protein n=1 Tax=Oryza sativa subsp. japonica TaxID=39947 RepID=Q6EQ00_ORYSJ|nr:hypothetical protein [Oryza sativa Japonica Group]
MWGPSVSDKDILHYYPLAKTQKSGGDRGGRRCSACAGGGGDLGRSGSEWLWRALSKATTLGEMVGSRSSGLLAHAGAWMRRHLGRQLEDGVRAHRRLSHGLELPSSCLIREGNEATSSGCGRPTVFGVRRWRR